MCLFVCLLLATRSNDDNNNNNNNKRERGRDVLRRAPFMKTKYARTETLAGQEPTKQQQQQGPKADYKAKLTVRPSRTLSTVTRTYTRRLQPDYHHHCAHKGNKNTSVPAKRKKRLQVLQLQQVSCMLIDWEVGATLRRGPYQYMSRNRQEQATMSWLPPITTRGRQRIHV